jgi:hypothetical protein
VVLVAEFVDPSGAALERFVMEKTAVGWRYDVVDPNGWLQVPPPERCAECHHQATSDEVFGPPRAAAPQQQMPDPTSPSQTPNPAQPTPPPNSP